MAWRYVGANEDIHGLGNKHIIMLIKWGHDCVNSLKWSLIFINKSVLVRDM